MKINARLSRILASTLLVLFGFAALASTGCTVHTNGVTLPNPYYHKGRVQYFPSGTEFPFPNEAASLQEADRDFR